MGQQAQRPGRLEPSPPWRDWTGPYRRVVEACVNLAWQAAILTARSSFKNKHSRPTGSTENGQQCSM
jgi:hypothetical protein